MVVDDMAVPSARERIEDQPTRDHDPDELAHHRQRLLGLMLSH